MDRTDILTSMLCSLLWDRIKAGGETRRMWEERISSISPLITATPDYYLFTILSASKRIEFRFFLLFSSRRSHFSTSSV